MAIWRKTFIFHRDWWDMIKELDNVKKYQAIDQLCDFGFSGERPECYSPSVSAILDIAEPKIHADYARFTDYVAKKKAERNYGVTSLQN